MKKSILLILLLSLTFIISCKDNKEPSVSSENKSTNNTVESADNGKLLFTINGRNVHEKEARIDDLESAINDEILYEAAIKRGIDKEPAVQRSLYMHRKNLFLGLLKRRVVQDYLKTHEITDEQINEYYNKNINKYTVLDVTVFSAPDIDTANFIKEELSKGTSPENIMDKYKNQDINIKLRRIQNSKSFIDKFDNLEAGLISEPIDQKSVFKIVRIDRVNTAPINKIGNSIRYELTNNLRLEAVQKYIEEQKKNMEIKLPPNGNK